jgi:hypothetical protein
MNDSELRQQITAIASHFRLFECVECATVMRQFGKFEVEVIEEF